MSCIFCQIVEGTSPASIICQDDRVMAFMSIRPTTPSECWIIPKTHVDHFTDLDDDTAQRIMVVGQHLGRRIMSVFKPLRVGMLVHGFGVPHAHFKLWSGFNRDTVSNSEPAQLDAVRQTLGALSRYLQAAVNQVGTIELYTCWMATRRPKSSTR